jgi:hypothetical protein
MKLEERIKGLKSVEQVSDPAKIEALLKDRDTKIREATQEAKHDAQTVVGEDATGRMFVEKRVTNSIASGFEMPPTEDLRKLAEKLGIEWRAGFEERVIPYFGSDERVDRHGDIVRQNWNFKDFANNPVVAYSHQWDMPPIGNSLKWEVVDRKDKEYEGPALFLLNLFVPGDVYAWGDTVYRLVKSGFLRTSSVGFYPGIILDIKDEKEREELGLGRWGVVLEACVLVEHSPTTIPANTGAFSLLRSAKASNMLRPGDAAVVRELTRQECLRSGFTADGFRSKDAGVIAMWKALFPKSKLELSVHKNLDEPILPTEQEIELNSEGTTAPTNEEGKKELEAIRGEITELKESLSSMGEAIKDIRSLIEDKAETEAKAGEEEEQEEQEEQEGKDMEFIEDLTAALRAANSCSSA